MTTTTTRPTANDPAADQRRADTLRWLISAGQANNLPMPARIQFGRFVDPFGETRRYLTLDLDDDADLTGWATAIDADDSQEFDVVGDTHTWTHVAARTGWRDGPNVDWHLIEVTTRHHRSIPAGKGRHR
jgi:hypothetical protein